MRRLGRPEPTIAALPSAEHLRAAARHQQTAAAFAPAATTGIAKGVYRFRTQEEADAQRMEATVRVVAEQAARLRR